MKILHTSDWHIGIRLHGHDLSQDHELFFTWLIKLIKKETIDVLLVSGDIFDLANPSSEARKMYYEILVKLSGLNCQVILTGGNHDSPSMLNAPKEVLKELNINVIGGYHDKLEELIIPLKDKEGNVKAVVASIPFLRDSDLRKMVVAENYEDRIEAIREGIKMVFENSAEECKSLYPNITAIAMGHLYTQGSCISDSEREIQIGNLAGFESDQFDKYFQYIALGHIHKPQDINQERNIIYSGSPILLSFSEKLDKKRVVMIDIDNVLIYESIEVPEYRKLVKIEGSLIEVSKALELLDLEHNLLPTLVEVELIEDNYDPGTVIEFEDLLGSFDSSSAQIVKQRIQFKNRLHGSAGLYTDLVSIDELKPEEVFRKRMEKEDLPEKQSQLLEEAFSEILLSMQQGLV